jgi:hypothetical protein
MTTVTAERQKAVHVRLMEILFITRTNRKVFFVVFPSSVNFFLDIFPPLLSHGWKAEKNPGNLLFFSLPFYFPVFTREKDIPVYWEKNNRNG